MGVYVFDDKWQQERERLAGLETLYDPTTIRHLEAIGVSEGWSCLEVGGGAGSIAQWLCARVGSRGSVLATDVSTRFLDALSRPNLDVRKHDISSDDLPTEAFDLIHARLVLAQLPSREQALKRMASAVRPGGWIVVEDLDWGWVVSKPIGFLRFPATDPRRSAKVLKSLLDALRPAGYDPEYGGRLPGDLISEGFIDVGAEMHSPLTWGGTRATLLPSWLLESMKDQIVSSGISARHVDQEIRVLADPNVAFLPPPLVTAWARRAETDMRITGGKLHVPPRTESAIDWLRAAPLLEGCAPAELSRVASLARRVDAAAGETLTAEGEPGETFYLIATGSATVSRGGVPLASLGPGSYFGEIAILERGPRTATVSADTPMRMFEIEAADFAGLLRDIPIVQQRIETIIAERKAREAAGS